MCHFCVLSAFQKIFLNFFPVLYKDFCPDFRNFESMQAGRNEITQAKLQSSSSVDYKLHDCDRHGLGSKPTRDILLCLRKKIYGTFPCLVFLEISIICLNFNHISIKPKKNNKKLQADSDVLVYSEAGRVNCLPYVLAPLSLSCELGG